VKEIIIEENAELVNKNRNPFKYLLKNLSKKVLENNLVGIPLYHLDCGLVEKDKISVFKSILHTEKQAGVYYSNILTFKSSGEIDRVDDFK
jgi:hypothetical protein